jgi:hypothetical protein
MKKKLFLHFGHALVSAGLNDVAKKMTGRGARKDSPLATKTVSVKHYIVSMDNTKREANSGFEESRGGS